MAYITTCFLQHEGIGRSRGMGGLGRFSYMVGLSVFWGYGGFGGSNGMEGSFAPQNLIFRESSGLNSTASPGHGLS